MTADRLRSLVKEATREVPGVQDRTTLATAIGVREAREELETLAPQLAELVADMAEAAQNAAEILRALPDLQMGDSTPAEILEDALARLADLFPEDSA